MSDTTPLAGTLQAIRDILMFEHWLRFYFIREDGERLVLDLPPEAKQQVRECCPELASIMDELAGKEPSAQAAWAAVDRAASLALDSGEDANELPRLFAAPELEREMLRFQDWVQENENSLDAKALDFTSWRAAFDEWRSTKRCAVPPTP